MTWIVLGRPPRTPEGVVAAYFAALADRDADDARDLVARSEDEKVETVLMDDETLERADYTPPSDVSIIRFDPLTGLTASVQATYKIAGVTYQRDLHVRRVTRLDRLGMRHIGASLPPGHPDMAHTE